MSTHYRIRHGLLLAALGIVIQMPATAAPWSFGIISDTQWAPQNDTNRTVAIHVIDRVNEQFVAHGVDLVLQVGDLHDTISPTAIGVRAAHNQALADAGIPFYPVRGNHDDERRALSTYKATFDQSAYSTPSFGADGQAAQGLSYAFTHENAKFVLIDPYAMPNGKRYTVADHQPWIDSELAAADHDHAFVLAHPNLQGQNHKDNLFGGSPDANPDMQNAFIQSLDDNGVRYYFSGHDHMHHRAVVTSPDGQSRVMQVIGASDSFKFYDPAPPYSAREQNVAQELETIGYYVYTVDGPRVSGRFYSSPIWWTQPDGTDGSPTWTLRETFGYSLNGQQFLVQPGQSFAGIQDVGPVGAGWIGTEMAILDGVNATWS
nr:metallophosphoesterase [Thiobacillaceae bacterium]